MKTQTMVTQTSFSCEDFILFNAAERRSCPYVRGLEL